MKVRFYRFEVDEVGIYEAVERDCPRDDNRRNNKPDGSWLPKVGPQFPGAISYWTEYGLRKYLDSGLFHWHRTVVSNPVSVIVEDDFHEILFQDNFQVVVNAGTTQSSIRKSAFEFICDKSWDLLRAEGDREGTQFAIRLLGDEVLYSPRNSKALFELAGAYDFLDEEEMALGYYEQVLELGFDKLPLEDRPRLYVQMGSTLRNCFKLEESRDLLMEGVARFPGNSAIKAFLALTNYTDGKDRQTAKSFIQEVVTQGEAEYLRALKYYLENIDMFPAKIRQGRTADREQIEKVVFEVLTEYGLRPDPDGTDSDLKDVEASYIKSGGVFEVIESPDGLILGTGGLFPVEADACEVRKMYLSKSARGKGLGKKLLQRLLQKAKELGFKRVELETASVLKEAIGLYESFGFKKVSKDNLVSRCDQAFVLDLD